MVVDQTKVMINGCKILKEIEEYSDEQRTQKEEAADLILGVIENLDVAINLVQINGFKDVIKCMIGSQYPSVRKRCASIFSTAVQNNPPVQKNAIDEHALEGLYAIIPVETDLKLKEQYISCISSLVRGEFPVAREKFVEYGGLELINSIISGFESIRIVKKCLLMISDLLYNSRSKGDVKITEICKNIGLIDNVSQLVNNSDQEIIEMAQWTIHNSLIPAQ